jgi:hypothetical protein
LRWAVDKPAIDVANVDIWKMSISSGHIACRRQAG